MVPMGIAAQVLPQISYQNLVQSWSPGLARWETMRTVCKKGGGTG